MAALGKVVLHWFGRRATQCTAQVVLEAEPRQWQSGNARPGGTPEQLHPFLAGAFRQVALDLAVLRDSGATHIGVSAASVQVGVLCGAGLNENRQENTAFGTLLPSCLECLAVPALAVSPRVGQT